VRDTLIAFAREHYNALVVLAGVSLLGAASGSIGAFAVLRRRALVGDALSHAALPGLCLAFLLLRERNLVAMLAGALVSGIVALAILAALARWTRVKDDAALGTVLTVFFGLGIVLLKVIQNLEGTGSKAGLHAYIFGKTAGMTRDDLAVIAIASAVGLALVLLFYKVWQVITFDPEFAATLGWPVYGLDLALMSLVACAVVIGLPSVGVVLVSALLILPAVSARCWTDRLAPLLVLAGGLGGLIGMAGSLLSAAYAQLPAGPIIVLCGTAVVGVSLLAGTRRGLLVRWRRQHEFHRDWRRAELLRVLYEHGAGHAPGVATSERPSDRQAPDSQGNTLAAVESALVRRGLSPRAARAALRDATHRGLIAWEGAQLFLTPAGWRDAVRHLQREALWQLVLAEHPDLATSGVNLATDDPQSLLPADECQRLIAQLRQTGRWPTEEAA
jgi:manganese/zinc/iron transport system permease protein